MPEQATGWSPKPLVHGTHSMIVTNNPWASAGAQQILKSQGNAVDAAIAAAFVLGVTEPQSSGLGGGGYALSYDAQSGNLVAYDGRESAPQSAHPAWFLDKKGQALSFNDAWLSPKSVGVPGEMAMLMLMHQQQGHLAWKKLLQPAIRLAKDGFKMSPRLFRLLSLDQAILVKNEQIKLIYFMSDGRVKPIGTTVKNLPLAHTLELIAEQPQAFYQGKIAQDMIRAINNQSIENTLYTADDFKRYQALSKPALCDHFRDYLICTVPPPAGGIVVLELLKLYAAHYLGHTVTDVHWVYTFLEASKLVFADQHRYLADPAFVHESITGLLADEYIQARRQLITDKAMSGYIAPGTIKGIQWPYASDSQFQPHGTTSLTIVDAHHHAVVMSLSLEHQFGSHIMVDGFFLNNQMTDFAFAPKDPQGRWVANRVEVGKRPRSSMSPMMVFDKHHRLQVLAASPGGTQIICYVAKSLVQMLDFNWDPEHSAASGHLCVIEGQPMVEAGSDLIQLIPALEKQGEFIHISDQFNSGETNIKRDPKGGWWGGADPRREGEAIGDE